MDGFAAAERARIDGSGWLTNPALVRLLGRSTTESARAALDRLMTPHRWAAAGALVAELRATFADLRFGDRVDYGVLLVPPRAVLDVRGPLPADVRAAQHPTIRADVAAPALGAGHDALPDDDWGVFAGVVGRYGPSAGSVHDVTAAPAARYTVAGVDTRRFMTRQLWAARLLQAGPAFVPDSELNESWTFTVFPGEDLVDGQAESGTVLKGKVRFRLGRADRGIGSARIAPAVPVP
jgi:hypothetical protein